MSAHRLIRPVGRFSDVNAQPKLFPRALLDEMGVAPGDFSLDLDPLWLARRQGYAIVEHPVVFGIRAHGEAKGGGSLRLKWELTRRTFAFIRTCGIRFARRRADDGDRVYRVTPSRGSAWCRRRLAWRSTSGWSGARSPESRSFRRRRGLRPLARPDSLTGCWSSISRKPASRPTS